MTPSGLAPALGQIRRLVRAFGPVMARPRGIEPLRAALGAGLGLLACGLILAGAAFYAVPDQAGLVLIAPLGASAFLMFAVPNSPLAQPWSAVVGNSVSALVAVAVLHLDLPVTAAAGLAVGLAMVAMALLRALHPPGAAVALTTVLAAPGSLGYGFVLVPVMLDTVLLMLVAIAFNRATGRKYPFRQPHAESVHHTRDAPPDRRLGLSPEDLADLLGRFNLSANIGAEDFGRVLAAAEEAAAERRFAGLRCGEVMSRDVVRVAPATRLRVVADLFRRHAFKALPVCDTGDRLVGIITQNDLIQRARRDARLEHRSFAEALSGLLRTPAKPPRARDIMTHDPITVLVDTPVGALLHLLADGGVQAVPVLEGARMVGILTRSDLLAVLARDALWAGVAPPGAMAPSGGGSGDGQA